MSFRLCFAALLFSLTGFALAGSPSAVPFASETPLPQPAPSPVPDLTPASPDGGLFPPPPPPSPPPKLWKGSFEAGASGATGNSEVLNVRVFSEANRKTETNLLHADLTYLLGKQEGRTIQNTAIANLRDEILFPGTPWSIYGMTFYDYDEFRDYKTILGIYGGLAYAVSDTEELLFKLRGGFGTLYKTGGRNDDVWEPSLNLGYDFRWRIGERSALISTLDYYPSLENGFSDFLLRLRVAYEVTVDPVTGMFFRVGIFERYDSSPGPGVQRSDLNYYIAFGRNF